MFLVVMDWNLSNVTMLFGLTLVSVPIAWFQVSKVEFKRSNDADRYGRTTIYVKKGLPYLWGWLITILLGIGCSALFETLTPNLVLKEIFSELKNELLTFSIFTQHSDWYIWFLSGATSSLYTRFLKIKEPAVINALKRK
ncbi:hypothetical protein NRF22_03420 [Oenococcus kitaharae]|nr:hypothetical protein [Oenococcus kitaharae]MCV3296166.1 hypothetical protein [Oenococcus kitaharae]